MVEKDYNIIIIYNIVVKGKRQRDMKQKEIKEAEQIILNYFTELFLANEECTDTEAMLDIERCYAYDLGHYEEYVEASIKLAEEIKSHI